MNNSLFRQEALTERQTQWLGTVLLTPQWPYRFFTIYALVVTISIISLLCFGEYTTTAKVNGWLVPEQGMINVFAIQTGIVSQISVKEGDTIAKGNPLLTLSTDLQSKRLGNTQENMLATVTLRRMSLQKEVHQQNQLFKQQQHVYKDRLASLLTEEKQIDEEITLQIASLKLADKTMQRFRTLHEKDIVSDQEYQLKIEAKLSQATKLQDLQRQKTNLRREYLATNGELNDLPLKLQSQHAAIQREITHIDQELTEIEAKREVVISAPQTGTVTAIQTEIGSQTNPSTPLLSILPKDSQLEAHLYTPSRSIGFVRPGQKVLLRYQAYPYQKFGHYEGVVSSISGSAINPQELPAQLHGLTAIYGTSEPVYRICVKPLKQTVTAYGQLIALQPGMQLDADIVIERRKLFEWVLEPLFTLTGQWPQ